MQMGQRDEDMMMMMQSIQSKLEMAGRGGDEKQELWTGAVSREGQKA